MDSAPENRLLGLLRSQAEYRKPPGYDAWPPELRTEYDDVLVPASSFSEPQLILREALVADAPAGGGLHAEVQRTLLHLLSDNASDALSKAVVIEQLLARMRGD